MKMINLQNCTGFWDRMFKVVVNGEELVMRHQFLTIQVPDDQSFEVKVKYSWDASPVYTFNPKEDAVLQISKNRRLINTSWILLIAGLGLGFVIAYLFENVRFISFAPLIAPLFMMIYQTVRRKKYFVIREISKSGKEPTKGLL